MPQTADLFSFDNTATPASPENYEWVRRRLGQIYKRALNADMNPWNPVQSRDIRKSFAEMSALLPAEDGEPRLAAFLKELDRLEALD